MYQTKVLSTGIYTPPKVLTNQDLEKFLDTSNEWIIERTGIKQRHVSSYQEGEFGTDMAHKASLQALERAGLEANDIDLILYATCTADYKLPSSSCVLQHKLGITNQCAAVDLAAACSGYVYAFHMADALIKTGMNKNVLIVGAEIMTREVDWEDRTMCVLFGDAAGATILSRAEEGDASQVLSSHISADGSGWDLFTHLKGGTKEPVTKEDIEERKNFMAMRGRDLFKVATRTLAENVKIVAEKANVSIDDINWLIPHQANIRIIEHTGKILDIPKEKVVINIQKYGNTSSATIPLAFHEAIEEGKIKRGDLVLFDAFGAGVTAGATLIRY
ncbi:MAG: beta-ketoacyl-ACP synthase III [Bacteriovoracaceae bacterium]